VEIGNLLNRCTTLLRSIEKDGRFRPTTLAEFGQKTCAITVTRKPALTAKTGFVDRVRLLILRNLLKTQRRLKIPAYGKLVQASVSQSDLLSGHYDDPQKVSRMLYFAWARNRPSWIQHSNMPRSGK
jgi:hypothetical protein